MGKLAREDATEKLPVPLVMITWPIPRPQWWVRKNILNFCRFTQPIITLLLCSYFCFYLHFTNSPQKLVCRSQMRLEIWFVVFFRSASNAMFCNLIFKLNFYFEMYSLYRIKFKFVKMLPFSGQPIRVTVGVRGKYPFLFMM